MPEITTLKPINLQQVTIAKPISVQLVFDELRANRTTERNSFNDRDEVYFVVAGVSGSKKARHKIAVPRVSPPPPQDYFQFWNGTIINNVGLQDLTLQPGDTALLNVVIREQDNSQRGAIFEAAQAAAAGVIAIFTGEPTAGKIAEEKAKSAIKQFYESLGQDGDQNIGGFSVQMTNSDGKLTVEWYDGPATLITSQNGLSATFEAEDSDANYTGRIRAKIKGWSEWQSLGGQIIGAPAVFSRNSSIIDVFAQGTNNRLWLKHWQIDHWEKWAQLDDFIIGSSPAACSMGPEDVNVFVRGADGQLYHKFWALTRGGWSGWALLGGRLIGAPGAFSRRNGIIDVFVRGTDNQLWQRSWDTDRWLAWQRPDSENIILDSSPVVASTGQKDVSVYARGKDGQLCRKVWVESEGWHKWERLGGQIVGAPGVYARNNFIVDVFVQGTDNRLHQKHWQFDHWEDWWFHADNFILGSSPAVDSLHAEHVHVFARGQDGQAWFKTWTG